MILLDRFKTYLPYFLPLLLPFSRSIADITIVLVSSLFLIKSYQENNWKWAHDKWFIFAIIFWLYCILINSPLSIKPFESLAYSFFFLRWPLFAMALTYWIFNDAFDLKKFFISISLVMVFIIFDTWWQYFYGADIFGYKSGGGRLTGPFRGHLYVGAWIAKLVLLPPLILILCDQFKPSPIKKQIIIWCFVLMMIAFLTVYISGERMALLLMSASIIFFSLGILSSRDTPKGIISLVFILSTLMILFFASYYPEVTNRAFHSTIDKIVNWRSSDYGLVWKSAYDVWMQSPITGVGLHKYREACGLLGIYGTVDNAIGGGVCFHPHNISLELLSETGLVGLLLFFAMVAVLTLSQLKKLWRKKEWLSFSLVFCILFTCFLPIASSTSFFSNKYASIIWLLIGVMLSVLRVKNKTN